MSLQKTILVIFLSLFAASFLSAMGGKAAMIPAKMRKLNVKDMEYHKYVTYYGNEIKNYGYYVYKLSSDGKTLDIYLDGYNVSGPLTNMPSKLEDFAYHFVLDYENYTLLKAYENMSNNNFTEKVHGSFYNEYIFNYTNLQLEYTAKTWNGDEIKTQKSRIALRKGYSYSVANTMPTFLRMIDPTSSGIFYFVMPEFLKDALMVAPKDLGKEEITTPAGKFRTEKIKWSITDTFLSQLVKSTSDNIFLWIEIDTLRMIKFVDNSKGQVVEFIEAGTWPVSKK